jgi:hypothetical protein
MGQEIASLIFHFGAVIYLFVAAFFIYVFYSSVPEEYPVARIAVAFIVICIAMWLPSYRDKKLLAEADLKASVFRSALTGCRANLNPINTKLLVNSLHIDRQFLNVLLYGSYKLATYEKIVRFMLEHKVDSIETQYAADLLPPGSNWTASSSEKYMQFRFAKRGDDKCSIFDDWIRKYPESDLLSLRKLGLPDDACIGVSFSNAMRSDFAITVEATAVKLAEHMPEKANLSKIDKNIKTSLENRFKNWERYTVSFTRNGSPTQSLATFSEDFSFGDGDNGMYSLFTPCQQGGQERALLFFKSLRDQSRLTSMVNNKTILINERLISETDDSDLRKIKWIKNVDRSWNENNFSIDGLIWIDSSRESFSFPSTVRYTLNVMSGHEKIVIPLYFKDYSVNDLTGLGVSDGKIATIVFGPGDRQRGPRHLLVLDLKKNIVTLTTVTDQQYARLLS